MWFKRRVFFLAGFLSLAFAAGPARADDTADVRGIFDRFSECAARHDPREAAAVVLSYAKSDDIVRRYPNLLSGECLADTSELRIPGGDYARYGLAEALLRREYANGLPADIAQAAPLAHPEVKDSDFQPKPGKTPTPKELADLQKDKEKAVAARLASIYGECVARADPADVLRLVKTRPSSKEEGQAFAGMNGALSSCLLQGQTLTFGKAMLRGAVAMNLYRLAKAPRVPASVAVAK